jgi:hypothetical protein
MMVRVFVLYGEEPPAERYAEHVELSRREVPEATIRHGRIFGSPEGKPEYAYYFEYEFADREAMKRSQDGLVKAADDAAEVGVPSKVFFADLEE